METAPARALTPRHMGHTLVYSWFMWAHQLTPEAVKSHPTVLLYRQKSGTETCHSPEPAAPSQGQSAAVLQCTPISAG